MRITLAVAVACFSLVAVTTARDAEAAIRRQTNIAAQGLAPALRTFTKERDVQLVYRAELVSDHQTSGAAGDLTFDEALTQLLSGTGLTYRYLDKNAITIVPIPSSSSSNLSMSPENSPLQVTGEGSEVRDSQGEGKAKPFWDRFRVAQVDQGASSKSSSSEGGPSRTNQNSDTSSESATKLEEIVVTGTHIKRSDFESPTPITALSGDEMNLAGVTTLADLPDKMTQFQPGRNAKASNFAYVGAGASRFDLRGLGTTRTLTLVDGHRYAPFDTSGEIDTNMIPSGIVERVDVATGGSSAVYGSDAVAGVVNIVLRKNIEGLEGSLQGGESAYHDDKNWKATLNFGTHFAGDRGRFIVATEATDSDGIDGSGGRAWDEAQWGLVSRAQAGGSGPYDYVLSTNVRGANTAYGGLITSGVLNGTAFLPGSIPVKFNPGTAPLGSFATIGGDGTNDQSLRTLLISTRRETVYGRLSFAFNDQVTGYLEGNYAASHIDLRNNFSDDFFGDFNNITIHNDNAFLPASLRSAMQAAGQNSFTMSRVNIDMPPLNQDGQNRYHQIVAGLEGKFGKTWSWTLRYADGTSTLNNFFGGDVLRPNLALAVDAVTDPATGRTVCRSTLASPNNGCVPLNLFGQGSPSAQAISYVFGPDVYSHFTIGQRVADASMQGEPFSNWAGPVSMAAGAEYRSQTYSIPPDPTVPSRTWDPIGSSPVGKINVTEAFAETDFPLLRNEPLAQRLGLNAAVRETHYNLVGSVTTWKVGLTDEVTDNIRLRAARSRDIRAPNYSELFAPPANFVGPVTDLNGQTVPVTETLNSNANLKPENADTWTAGLALKFSAAGDFHADIDYFHTVISGAVSSLGPQQVLDGCGRGDADLCRDLTRDSSGTLTHVTAGLFNSGSLVTNGFDMELGYTIPVATLLHAGRGTVSFRANGSQINYQKTTDLFGNSYEAVGSAIPRWNADAGVTYAVDRWSLNVAEHFVGGLCCGLYSVTPPNSSFKGGSGVFYLRAGFQYSLKDVGGVKVQLFGNVENLLNRAPPVLPLTLNFLTYPTNFFVYDVIGRTINLGVRVKL